LEGEEVSGLAWCLVVGRVGGIRGAEGVGQRHHARGVVVLVLHLRCHGFDLEFLRLGVRSCDRGDGHLQAGRQDLQFLQGCVRVDRSTKRLHVLGANLGEVLHGLDVLTADIPHALQPTIGKGDEVFSALLGLLLIHVLVFELVRGVYGFGLEERKREQCLLNAHNLG